MRSCRQGAWPIILSSSDIIVSLPLSLVVTKLFPFTIVLLNLSWVRHKMKVFKINGTLISRDNEIPPTAGCWLAKSSLGPLENSIQVSVKGAVVVIEVTIYKSGVSKVQPAGKSSPLSVFVNKVLLKYNHTIHWPIVCGFFHTTVAELNSCNRDHSSGSWKCLLSGPLQKKCMALVLNKERMNMYRIIHVIIIHAGIILSALQAFAQLTLNVGWLVSTTSRRRNWGSAEGGDPLKFPKVSYHQM